MKKTILIYPSGAENAIEIYNSIKDSIHLKVIPASAKVDHSELIYGQPIQYLPNVNEFDFVEKLNDFIRKEKIDYIFPTHDTVALYLSQNNEAIACEIITSNFETNYICRYKKETYNLFKNFDFCPTIYDKVYADISYPIFAKPNVGEGSKGVSLVKSKTQHLELTETFPDSIFLEFLPGKEFTIDCLTNRHGELQFVGPRERVEIQMGISFRSREVIKEEQGRFNEIAQIINSKLKFRGLWFFQLKEAKDGSLKLMEISTRAAGTIGFFRHKGVNLPLLSVFDFFEWDIEINENNYGLELFRSTKNRYKYSFQFKRVYLDLDDTLIINGQVNVTVICFVYQCINLGKEVILLSKHTENIEETLDRFNISKNLFAEIICLHPEERKVDYIVAKDAIFIDNWYKERKEVSQLKIPVLDVDAVGSLLIN